VQGTWVINVSNQVFAKQRLNSTHLWLARVTMEAFLALALQRQHGEPGTARTAAAGTFSWQPAWMYVVEPVYRPLRASESAVEHRAAFAMVAQLCGRQGCTRCFQLVWVEQQRVLHIELAGMSPIQIAVQLRQCQLLTTMTACACQCQAAAAETPKARHQHTEPVLARSSSAVLFLSRC
jgi:hypothetical protein